MADASSEVETQSMENVMPTIRWWILAFLLTMLWPTMVRANDDAFFERKIRPILAGTCFKCHGGEKTNGKLRVDTREMLLKGGRSVVAENLPADELGVFQG
jgi:Planctomycete cytochrome C